MRDRKHTNNEGRRGIKTGSYTRKLKRLAKKLKINFDDGPFGSLKGPVKGKAK